MESHILDQCLPHIKTVDDLIQFAAYYKVKDLPCVKHRLFQLQVEEMFIDLDLPNTDLNYDLGDIDMEQFLSEIDEDNHQSRKRAPSPEQGPSKLQKLHNEVRLSPDVDSLNDWVSGSLFFEGECEIQLDDYIQNPIQLGAGFENIADLSNTFDKQMGQGSDNDSTVDSEDENGFEKPYDFKLKKSRTFAKNAAVESVFQIKFNEQWRGENLGDLHDRLHDMFDHVLNQVREPLQDNDLGRVVLHHPNLENPIVVPLRPLGELNANVVLDHISKVMKSHNHLKLVESFDVDVGVIDLPKGGANHRIVNVQDSVKQKLSIVEIRNNDEICLGRALAVCFAKTHTVLKSEWMDLLSANPLENCGRCRPYYKHRKSYARNLHMSHLALDHKKCPPTLYTNMKDPKSTQQAVFATELCDKAGVDKERPASLADIPKFEAVLNCQVLVVSAELGNKFITKGVKDDRTQLFVYLVDDNHYHAIPDISGFFTGSNFCESCLVPFQEKRVHECDHFCRVCKRKGCLKTDSPVTCQDCHMQCRSEDCYKAHKLPTGKDKDLPSQCQTWWRCPECFKVSNIWKNKDGQHVCNQYKCKPCQKMVPLDHHCYHIPLVIDDKPKQKRFIMFDFECSQDEVAACAEGYVPSPCDRCTDNECTHHRKCVNCGQSWCGQQEHRPNFVIAQSVCDACKDEALTSGSRCDSCGSRCRSCSKWDKKRKSFKSPPCVMTCGHREVQFRGPNTASEFCSWLFTKAHKDVSVFAHNFKGYDGYFLLDYLIQNSILPDNIVYNGSKLMYMHVPRGLNIRLLDSLSFFSCKLASLTKMFHLRQLMKGYFPHHFNVEGNQTYVGPYPDPSYYGVDSMSAEGRSDFLTWHARQKDKVFDFAKEIEDYCRSDVQILREALMTFRQLLMSVTERKHLVQDPKTKRMTQKVEPGIDPTDYVTIASVCHGVFKHKFLRSYTRVKLLWQGIVTSWLPVKQNQNDEWVEVKPGQWLTLEAVQRAGAVIRERETLPSPIAKVPGDGYSKDQYSQISIQWLEGLMHTHDMRIEHALNDGEYLIPGTKYKVDGYCRDSKTVYQFDGCLYHGCIKCYPHDRETTVLHTTKQSVSELYALTMKRNKIIKDKGYELVTIWEHEFMAQLKVKPDLKAFVSTLDLQERLKPRDSFFGGRTNASKLFYEAGEGEEILYMDFTSLYPWVNKYAEYPVGHPEIITRNFKALNQYFGLAKVKILPPRGLYHPVLPYKSNGKLKFALCRSCADTEQQTPCQHSDEKRSFIGTWCIPETLKALEKGYEILKLYEVYHWQETTAYDKTTKSGGLFADYINTFLKIKQESSGWPAWCQSDDDEQKYLSDYLAHEGVQLDYSKIEKNPGLRALSKLMLNSFWGKYAQRANMTQSKFVHSGKLEEFYKFLTDSKKKIHDFHILNDKVAQLQWTHETEFIPESDTTNIFIATFTTCYARLKLYSVLDMLQERVLYYDTDSVIFVSKPSQSNPPLGDYLGDLTDELGGDPIQVFASSGPKSYGYRTQSGEETCKVKGFTLNYANSQIINFESVKDLVLSPTRNQTLQTVNPSKICRDKYSSKIYNKFEKKRYRLVYTKRVIQPNLDTLPYGY